MLFCLQQHNYRKDLWDIRINGNKCYKKALQLANLLSNKERFRDSADFQTYLYVLCNMTFLQYIHYKNYYTSQFSLYLAGSWFSSPQILTLIMQSQAEQWQERFFFGPKSSYYSHHQITLRIWNQKCCIFLLLLSLCKATV